MKDVTSHLLLYRECIRHLWNTYFVQAANDRGWDVVDDFKSISSLTFDMLVSDEIGVDVCHGRGTTNNAHIQIVPEVEGVPILINKPRAEGSGYWDDPVNRIGPNDAKLLFVDFFDWDKAGLRDLQFWLVDIADFTTQPHLNGRPAAA